MNLMARRVAAEAGTWTAITGVPPGALVPAGGTAQEHPPVLELQHGIVAVQSAHGGLQLIERSCPQATRMRCVRGSRNGCGRDVLAVADHGSDRSSHLSY